MCTETLSLLTAHIHIAYTDPSSCAFGTRMQAPFMRVSEAIFCANDRTKNDKRQGCEFGAYSENGLQTTIRRNLKALNRVQKAGRSAALAADS